MQLALVSKKVYWPSINPRNRPADSLRFSLHTKMSSVDKDTFLSSPLDFHSFFLAYHTGQVLQDSLRHHGNRHPSLVLHLKANISMFSIKYDICYGFLIENQINKIYFQCVKMFFFKKKKRFFFIMNRWWILATAFPASVRITM